MKLFKIMPIFLGIVIGSVFGVTIIKDYKSKEKLTSVFNNSDVYYVVQKGVYSNIDDLKKDNSSLTYYIYTIEDGLYYVYLGITKNKQNLHKLTNYFKELGYDVIESEISFSNQNFSNILTDYDEMLKKTDDKNAIKTIYLQVLAKYNELVVDDEY